MTAVFVGPWDSAKKIAVPVFRFRVEVAHESAMNSPAISINLARRIS